MVRFGICGGNDRLDDDELTSRNNKNQSDVQSRNVEIDGKLKIRETSHIC